MPKQTYSFLWLKLDLYDIAFIFLLVASLLVRIYLFDYPPIEARGIEGSRDYLIARHIAQYHEFPLTGPSTLIHPLLSSPIYYYFISLFLIIKDSVLFLVSVFILFQLLTITLIYKIAKSFNPGTALIAALIFSFSVYILERSGNIWPNYAMQPFVNLSFFLLLLAYLRKSYKLLLFSTFIALFAAALQHSAFAMLPLLIIFVFLILKQQDKSIVHYLGVLLVGKYAAAAVGTNSWGAGGGGHICTVHFRVFPKYAQNAIYVTQNFFFYAQRPIFFFRRCINGSNWA